MRQAGGGDRPRVQQGHGSDLGGLPTEQETHPPVHDPERELAHLPQQAVLSEQKSADRLAGSSPNIPHSYQDPVTIRPAG